MKILSVECSATPASVAIIDDRKVLYSSFTSIKMTHSETLIPMISDALKVSKMSVDDIDYYAVSVGPGSFTGVRIGISAIKGLAAKNDTPCVPVSTLFAMAMPFINFDCIVCAVMDARCNQVYNALFKIENNTVTRLCEDRALLCDELKSEIERFLSCEKIIIVGDGADIFYPFVEEYTNVVKADETVKFQNAVGVGFASITDIEKNNTVPPASLLPVYLRLPQAECELKKKQNSQES
ncbi:MAG: tRNA (adenosine(37)-N6)-threonylcarbamoyltransferase complex dimerization subunit type 1 TsaB [Oscillospiraceae bacterium]|nr:tRNA (adenosine(37)-N6)-threonylcarbamoyltransferase complex dimerization subunit type 1 TsaB [Oscillospiraceae bacterium]